MTSEDLARLGVSADLAVHYTRAGWLVRLARGVFRRPEQGLSLRPSLKLVPAELPTGSDRPWVSRSSEGMLVLKP